MVPQNASHDELGVLTPARTPSDTTRIIAAVIAIQPTAKRAMIPAFLRVGNFKPQITPIGKAMIRRSVNTSKANDMYKLVICATESLCVAQPPTVNHACMLLHDVRWLTTLPMKVCLIVSANRRKVCRYSQ